MTGARALFAFNGLLILTLMYFYIKKKTNSYNAILAVLVLASSHLFLERAFRVRSDLLLSSLSLICLLLTINRKKTKEPVIFYILPPLLCALLLISFKGVYWLLFTICLILYDFKGPWPSLKTIDKISASILIFFWILSLLLKDFLFLEAIHQSFQFYFTNIKATWSLISQKGWILNFSKYSHITLFIERNLFLVFLIAVKFLFIICPTMIFKTRKWNLSDLYYFLLLAVLLFHPQQKFFFICALLPFF